MSKKDPAAPEAKCLQRALRVNLVITRCYCEERGVKYAIRIPANDSLVRDIARRSKPLYNAPVFEVKKEMPEYLYGD